MSQEEALPLSHLDEHRRSFPPRIDAQLQTRGKESGPLAVAVQQVADKFRQGMEDGWEGCWLPVAQAFSDVGARDVSSEGLNKKGSPDICVSCYVCRRPNSVLEPGEAFPSAITRFSRSSIEVIRSIATRRLLWRMFQPYH
ncbi:hypothetical protein CEP53_006445 [Fusarium sp. AF-6]|nr:hypothetical protein CEP53_006445 [Fusarium sp. AF-6]